MRVNSESRASNLCYKIAQTSQYYAHVAKNDWDRIYNVTIGIVFTAFAAEAMLNHYGFKLITNWNLKERNGRRIDNHEKIFEKIGLKDYSVSDEYKIIVECLTNRDKLAHGKTYNEELNINVDKYRNNPKEAIPFLMNHPSNIELGFTIKNLDAYLDTLVKIESDIEKISQLGEYPLSTSGVREW